MPKLEDIINKLGKAKYLSKLDPTKGFWQIPRSPQSKAKSAFVTPFGHFHFTVMPFGMDNSSATFVRMMKMVLPKLEDFSDAFISDEHLSHICLVLESLRKASLTAKPSKCMFGFKELEFLAHIVGNGEIRPVHQKVEVINKLPPSKTKRQIRSFIGMLNVLQKIYSTFCRNFGYSL